MGRDSLSVWTVSLTDESRYQECVRLHAHTECVRVCADSNLANATFRCSEKKDFEMRVAFKNFFLAQTGSRIVKTVRHFFIWTVKRRQELQ